MRNTPYSWPPDRLAVSVCRMACGVSPTWIVSLLLLLNVLSAANPPLLVQISNETGPPGGWVQIKVSLAVPQSVARGGIEIKLDPTVFGYPSDAAVFSTNGDAWGEWIPDRTVWASFSCGDVSASPRLPSIGLGQSRNLPMLVITVPILASAPPGKVVVLRADGLLSDLSFGGQIRRSPWFDSNGTPFDVSVIPGSVTVGGSLSIQSVVPGGGSLPAGTSVRINGTGFSPDTSVDVDGVSVAAMTFSGPQAIDLTLSGPTEFTGKRIVARNPDDSRVEFFSSLLDGSGFAHSYPSATLSGHSNGRSSIWCRRCLSELYHRAKRKPDIRRAYH